jgi:hypothetical protein
VNVGEIGCLRSSKAHGLVEISADLVRAAITTHAVEISTSPIIDHLASSARAEHGLKPTARGVFAVSENQGRRGAVTALQPSVAAVKSLRRQLPMKSFRR